MDIILTNPPFGGEEERGILGNFPEDKQTAETALLFLQLIMRKLRRAAEAAAAPAWSCPTARSSATACARASRRSCCKEFNLHTIVRLPNGVFAPYTSIPTNLLFFDRSGPTRGHLVLRAAAARGPEELHQDEADAVRGVRRLPRPGGTTAQENERAWKVPGGRRAGATVC